MTGNSEHRRYYRVQYSMAEQPCLIANYRKFRVKEISEGGARITSACSAPKCLQDPCPVRIIFHEGEEAHTDAVLDRDMPDGFVLRFV